MLVGPRHDFLHDLWQLVRNDDCYGQMGYPWFNPSDNLLLDFKVSGNDTTILTADMLTPANSPSSLIQKGITTSVSNIIGQVSVDWQRSQQPPSGKWLICGIKEQFPFITAHWTIDDSAVLFPYSHPHGKDEIRCIELFSGACGGWTAAARFISNHAGLNMRTLGIDNNHEAIASYAINHEATLITQIDALESTLASDHQHIALWGDIKDQTWWPIAAKWCPEVTTLSAPCQPWSSAGHEQGFAAEQGLLLAHGLSFVKKTRPPLVLLEQVPGFSKHPNHNQAMLILAGAGYQIKWTGVIDSAGIGAATRNRWLCIATLVGSDHCIMCLCSSGKLSPKQHHVPWGEFCIGMSRPFPICS